MRCYVTGEECTCDLDTVDCPNDAFPYEDYDDLGNSIREEYDQEYHMIQHEQMFDDHIWGT